MDAHPAGVSKREVRNYTTRPLPDAVLTRILAAGRTSGSSRNRQPWRFIVITDPAQLAAVRVILGAPDGVAISTILSLGYPAPGERRPRPNAGPTQVLARINRLPFSALVRRDRYARAAS